MQARQLALFTGSAQEVACFLQRYPHHLWLGNVPAALQSYINQPVPFAQAQNLLGQEFPLIIYNGEEGINLEALAIASGTLRQSGLMLILLPQWSRLSMQQDQDSQRWSGVETPICTPYFYQHFQQLCEKFHIPVYSQLQKLKFEQPSALKHNNAKIPTADQQALLAQILQSQAELIILTAKRGRGKSTLLGFLAQHLQQQQKAFYLSAPNKNAINQLQAITSSNLPFLAPDELALHLTQSAEQFKNAILIIDEAAMLPLSKLKHFSQHFKQVIFSTTVQSYEGTGRGFMLKFVAQLSRTFQHFSLQQPLRWQENDPLEQFIDELLLLDVENALAPINQFAIEKMQYRAYEQQALHQQKKLRDFYALLSLAHYRTSPIDLRRLFDAPRQQFYLAEQEPHLIGGVWLMEEGEMEDEALIVQIRQGLRRPRGNLTPQSLNFHQDLPQACQLRSLRISRIAVQPSQQNQGIGQQLISHICEQAKMEERDFISVSFGYSPELFAFWQRCGFHLLHLGDHLEASSGCYSLIMAKALSQQGQQLIAQGKKQVERNLPLLPHPLASLFAPAQKIDWALTPQDVAMLRKFACYQGNLYSCTPALSRLLHHYPAENLHIRQALFPASAASDEPLNRDQKLGKKMRLKIYREEVKNLLQKIGEIL